MRELKFRAWVKSKKIMSPVIAIRRAEPPYVEVPYNLVYREIISLDRPTSTVYISIDDVEIMQYIGLNDKNGRYIYEGDVLDGTLEGGVIRYSPEMARFVLSFGGEINEVHFNELDISENRLKDFSVMGNIYENPELACPEYEIIEDEE